MYLPNPSSTGRMWYKVNFLSVYQTIKETNLPYYLTIDGGRGNGFMPSYILAQNEMQTPLSQICTQVFAANCKKWGVIGLTLHSGPQHVARELNSDL